MVWDIRPRIPTVRSMSSLPMAGFSYAVGSKQRSHPAPASSSRISSPPPEYDLQQQQQQTTIDADGASPAPPRTIDAQLLCPADLERALVFQKQKTEARDRSRYMTQGNIMLQSSLQTQLSAESSEELQFSRELYLSSLDYLMRGVPTELTLLEKETLARNIKSLSVRVGMDSSSFDLQQQQKQEGARTQQLFVGMCRGTAVLIRLSVPRIKKSLETAIEFENRYHVLERSTVVLANSLTTVADRATRTSIPAIDVSRFISLASNIYFGLSVGLQEGYRVLNDDQAY